MHLSLHFLKNQAIRRMDEWPASHLPPLPPGDDRHNSPNGGLGVPQRRSIRRTDGEKFRILSGNGTQIPKTSSH
jgi:hypothetical protein